MRSYLNSEEIPTSNQAAFSQVTREYEDLTSIIMYQFESRQVSDSLLISLEKLKRLCDSLLRITKSNIEGWKATTIANGYDADVVQTVAQQTLEEYATRWGIAPEEV